MYNPFRTNLSWGINTRNILSIRSPLEASIIVDFHYLLKYWNADFRLFQMMMMIIIIDNQRMHIIVLPVDPLCQRPES
jgi:hypothetical protein